MNVDLGTTQGRDGLPIDFLRYLAASQVAPGDHLPSIQEISHDLGISPGKLREQLEVARQLGLVEVRPKTGIRRLPFTFLPGLRLVVNYLLACEPAYFEQFGDLRSQLETAFWTQAVQALTADDKQLLDQLVRQAWLKLGSDPVQIPHAEHRALHLTIFSRLDNTFVRAVLEAYWEAYEAIGLNVYADYAYLKMVWQHHERMVKAILDGDHEAGLQLQLEHAGLLHERPELHTFRRPEPEGQLQQAVVGENA